MKEKEILEEDLPNWFKPFLKPNAYTPTREFLRDLVPQSRLEAIVKWGFLELLSTYESFLVPNEDDETIYDKFLTADGENFMVPNNG